MLHVYQEYLGKGVLDSYLGSKRAVFHVLVYPKLCYNEPCYKEVQVYMYIFTGCLLGPGRLSVFFYNRQ